MAKGKILVIDDEAIVRVSCKRALEPEGYEVDVASSGEEGLKLVGSTRYDLVLIDLKMPGIDGMQVFLEIKRQHPEQNAMIMTGYDAAEDVSGPLSSVGGLFLEKPFTPDALAERINEALQK